MKNSFVSDFTRSLFGLSLGVALFASSNIALAQASFPNKPLRIIVPNSPGTLADSVARLMAVELSKVVGQPVIVEDKAGAGGRIGMEFVARAPADGYTILSATIPSLASLPATVKDMSFDPLKDLPPFISAGEVRFALGSPASLPWKSFRDLVADARANPGKYNYGSSAPTIRLPTEALLRGAGINIVHVPYSGAGPYFQALIAGQVQMGLVNEAQAVTFGERFRVLGVTGEQRSSAFPNAPTMSELGYPEIRGLVYSFHVAAGTPKAIVEQLYAAFSKALQTKEAKDQLALLKLVPISDNTPDSNVRRLQDEARLLTSIAKAINIQPE